MSAHSAIILAFCFSLYAILASRQSGNGKSNPFLILSAERAVYCNFLPPDSRVGHSRLLR